MKDNAQLNTVGRYKNSLKWQTVLTVKGILVMPVFTFTSVCYNLYGTQITYNRGVKWVPISSLSHFCYCKMQQLQPRTIPIRNEVLKGGHTNNWKRPHEATNLSARHNFSHKRGSWELEFYSFRSHPYAGISRFTAVWFHTLSFDNIIIMLASRKLSKSQLFWRFIPSAHSKVPCPGWLDALADWEAPSMANSHSTYSDLGMLFFFPPFLSI